MKTAILLHGNLRTFLMPMRDGSGRLCDRFMSSIVIPNNADVYAYTDSANFYHNGIQYYPDDRRIDILNNDQFRLHDKIEFIKHEVSSKIIETEVRKVIGRHLKGLTVEPPYDAQKDPKFKTLHDADVKGSSPTLLIHQWRKLKLASNMIEGTYDIVMKWRFDLNVSNALNLKNYDMSNTYVAGIHDPIIYDWHAFGKPEPMKAYIDLYDKLGCFLGEGRTFMYECSICGKRTGYGHDGSANCPQCNNTNIARHEITLAPEYHLFRIFKDSNTRIAPSNYPAHPYHYKENNADKRPIDEVIAGIGVKDITLVTYTAGKETGTRKF